MGTFQERIPLAGLLSAVAGDSFPRIARRRPIIPTLHGRHVGLMQQLRASDHRRGNHRRRWRFIGRHRLSSPGRRARVSSRRRAGAAPARRRRRRGLRRLAVVPACRLPPRTGLGSSRRRLFSSAPEATGRAGYFDFALDDATPAARRLERIVAWRCRVSSAALWRSGPADRATAFIERSAALRRCR